MANNNTKPPLNMTRYTSTFLRLYVDSLDNAVRAMAENNIVELIKWTWRSLEYFIKYLSATHIHELYDILRDKIYESYRRRNIEVDEKVIVESIIPRQHKSIRVRAYALEKTRPELRGLYETAIWAEPLFLALYEGYDDEEEIRNIALKVLSRLQELSKRIKLF